MSNFSTIKTAVEARIDNMIKGGPPLYRTDVSKDELWDTYLNSFPYGTNPIYKERTEHDCQCCKQYIRRMGNAVAIVKGEVQSIWRVKGLESPYAEVAKALAELVESRPIRDLFINDSRHVGTNVSHQETDEGVITWSHFHYELPKQYVMSKDKIPTMLGDIRTRKETYIRAMTELTLDAGETVLELIAQKSLYRGEEHSSAVKAFIRELKAFNKVDECKRDNFAWFISHSAVSAKIRNTAIGTLLIDLSDGVGLDDAVKKFEAVVAPANYKRPKAIFTKRMVEESQAKIIELGYSESLGRKHATLDDVNASNVLFINRDAETKGNDVFGEMIAEANVQPKNLTKVEEIDIDTFVRDVIPTAKSVELLVDNGYRGNVMSLIAPQVTDSPSIFKWDNGFSWAYVGDMADSDMRKAVQELGGRVDGALRFTHSWNHTGQNQSLMDLHVFMPGCKILKYTGPRYNRVGWNCRRDSKSGGVQDVDHVNAPNKMIPVENITFPSLDRMPEGKYTFSINNYSARSPNTTGFKAEIEFNGEIHAYEQQKRVNNGQYVVVAEALLKDGIFTIEHKIPSDTSQQDICGVTTNTFVPVSSLMQSPNHWDGEKGTGNKHFFFFVDGLEIDETPRGFFNEYLREDLITHKRVFEALGGKMRVPDADRKLSGFGFSSTQRNSVVLRVKGAFERTIKVKI